VLARDIPAYLSAGQKKDAAMRAVPFRLPDRMAIAPMELVQAWPMLLSVLAGSALLALPFGQEYMGRFLGVFLPLLGAVLMGSLAFPALLPLLPFRAFSLKGAVLGVLWAAASALALHSSPVSAAALLLVITPIVAFIAMNFTGSSTFTCQPGAALEVRVGIVPMIASLVIGTGLLIAARLFSL
jgi:acetyl-CoA decarbonylase/synthase complex subunit gamma